MSGEIAHDASRRKCILFAVAVLRADLPLLEAAVREWAADAREWELSRWLPKVPAALDLVERAADGGATPDDERRFRDTWLWVKEAAVLDQDFETAAYIRDGQDILSGADPEFPVRPPHHVRAARLLARHSRSGTAAASRYIADIFGNPFRPVAFSSDWRTDTAISLARAMYDARDFGAMPILADALQDAGCDDEQILAHCRDTSQPHVRGCWVVDRVLGKE